MSEFTSTPSKRQKEALRRDILILIHHHLLEEGFYEAAQAIQEKSYFNINDHYVCDNIDLSLILLEFQAFYQLRFHKKAKLTSSDLTKPSLESFQGSTKPARKSNKNIKHLEEPDTVSLINKQITLDVKPLRQQEKTENEIKTIVIPKELLQNEELRNLALSLSKEFLTSDKLPDIKWNDIIGHEEIKKLFETDIVLPFKYPELYEKSGLRHKTRGILLTGPPGTGKTMLAKAVARQSGMAFLNLNSSSISSKWRGDSEKLIRLAFDLAEANFPCVIYMDEVDAILGDRGHVGEHEASRRCKSEFLTRLDGILTQQRPLYFLASTNIPSNLDPAILRRFQRIFHLDKPNHEERCQLMQKHFDSVQLKKEEFDFSILGNLTKGFTGADLVRTCENAKVSLFQRLVEHKKAKAPTYEQPRLQQSDLEEAIKNVQSSFLSVGN